MHVVGLRGIGADIVNRGNSDSSSSSPAMAVLKILSILPTPSCAKSFHGTKPKPKLCSARAWSSQAIRADAGAAAVSDAASKSCTVGYFRGWIAGEPGCANPPSTSQILFLGTGTSECIPRVNCLTNPAKLCPVYLAAAQLGNKNRRRNTSLMVRYLAPDGLLLNIPILWS